MTTISTLPVTAKASGAVTTLAPITYGGAVAGAKAVIRGVARTPAADGEHFLLDADGEVTVISGAAFNPGDGLETDASGRFVPHTDGPLVARALDAAAAADEHRRVRLISH